ncbi:MAG: MoxR family ATPase [Lachnospiraceae bacterium]|nr:MoxR family ATPase [Lachnospiraceae bacterium]
MNMQEAKADIKNTIEIYLKKDEFGDYRIPLVRQRPIFLLGAPGIGKTAIVEQIAQELHLALVSYSMTHHTRQSALGLPFIRQKEFGGKATDVSEYTMSEIIAAVYETMEESGIQEGILFLDEINCVSETLAPAMLQFLQYKVFGRHRVPEGWVIVTAGNPPMYNKSVREFDIVTMDRLKVMEVEPDFQAFREYAWERNIHSAVLSFLELHQDFFYHMETTGKGKSYVTARGWEDLSQMIILYEENHLKVDESLVGQYLRNETIVREFCAYYDLYQKYKSDYQIQDILNGRNLTEAVQKAGQAPFDERLSLLGMLLKYVLHDMREAVQTSDYLQALLPGLRSLKSVQDVANRLEQLKQAREKMLKSGEAANNLSEADKLSGKRIIRFLTQAQKAALVSHDQEEAFTVVKAKFDEEVLAMKTHVNKTKEETEQLFAFVESAFGQGNEMLILVTELTANQSGARFIALFGCEAYQRNSDILLLSERQNHMQEKIRELNL